MATCNLKDDAQGVCPVGIECHSHGSHLGKIDSNLLRVHIRSEREITLKSSANFQLTISVLLLTIPEDLPLSVETLPVTSMLRCCVISSSPSGSIAVGEWFSRGGIVVARFFSVTIATEAMLLLMVKLESSPRISNAKMTRATFPAPVKHASQLNVCVFPKPASHDPQSRPLCPYTPTSAI